MDYDDLNIFLKRPLKDGSHYNHYFKGSSCRPTYLGKSDTAFTVKQMQKWVYNNMAYTKALALGEFSNIDLEKVCEKVHRFLFDHVQYELDSEDQMLKSPQCTWATRDQGTDCKSYSIFASSILCNLGIKHLLRRVKQPNPDFARTQQGIDPALWSHVYVVVPKDQNSLKADRSDQYMIIDATIDSNREGAFSLKHDTLMTKVSLKHYGLQSPALSNGLGACSCIVRPTPITKTVTGVLRNTPAQPAAPGFSPVPATRTQTTAPVSTRTTATATRAAATTRPATANTPYRTSTRTSSQVPVPVPGNIGMKAPFIGGRFGLGRVPATSVPQTTRTSSQVAGDYTGFILNAVQSGRQGAANNQAATSLGNKQQRLDQIGRAGATSSTVKAIGAGAAAYTWGLSLILTLIPSQWYEKVLGQWFSGGFKCIGSSWTPKTALQVAEIENDDLRNQAMLVLQSFQDASVENIEKGINNFIEYFYSIRSTERQWLATSAKDCTRDGLILMVKTLDEGLKAYIGLFSKAINQSGHALALNGNKKTVTYPPEAHTGRHSLKQEIPQYEIKLNPAVLKQIADQNAQAQAQALANGQGFNVVNQPVQAISQPKENNQNIIGAAALAALAYITF